MDLRRWYHFVATQILLLFYTNGVLSEITCTPGLQMPGYTVPQGDITIEEGHNLEIMCVVLNTTYNSSTLSFQRNGKTIPSQYIEVINSTAIKLDYPNPPLASGDTYTCVIRNETSVCMNRVTVGKKPQLVSDFSCISYNYDNLTCTWTAPQNYIETNYTLAYSLGDSRASRTPRECPHLVTVGNNMSCVWKSSTTPQYRPVHEYYNFLLNMSNTFGFTEQKTSFHHFAHVLPNPPENLTILNYTSSSIYLFWVVPLSMQPFVPGVNHRILYRCEYEGDEWQLGGILEPQKTPSHTYFNLTNLKYAYSKCEIKVSLRSAKALPTDLSMWSRNATIVQWTGSKIPDAPPETNIGSFEIAPSTPSGDLRDIYIYWKQIRPEQRNGPEFGYEVILEGNDDLLPTEKTLNYAKFSNLSDAIDYWFSIWSKNVNGTSVEKSTVFVPKQIQRIKEPSSFIKIESHPGEYELAWERPIQVSDQVITNYTIFTCVNERERPYQCTGQLNWTIAAGDKTSINMTVDKDKVIQFAISANSYDSSSGMLWAACTIIKNKSIGKMNNVWANRVGPTFIEMGWKLDCSDRIGSVERYIVYYCPVESSSMLGCKGPQYNMTFNSSVASGGNITNLKPYTTYRITVSVITKHNTFSQQSDPIYNTTLESVPSVPRHLRVDNATNTTISISWIEPEIKNGNLRHYLVKYTDNRYQNSHETEVNTTNFTIRNLKSYVNYTVSVAACTSVACSKNAVISKMTEMGYPNQIQKPSVDRRNDTTITVVWNKPSEPGGYNFYIVRVIQKLNGGNKTLEYNTTTHKYVIENCGDGGKFNTFYISVKAVNKIKGKDYEGPWSDELENYCYTPVNYIMYLLLFVSIAAVASIGFLFTRLYNRCKVMRDVEVKLPPGLAPVIADHTLVPWTTEKKQEKLPHPPPDEELLLVKMSEGRQFSGDSSGCSSGHESVTSSLESGTHISSSSDSGTYIPFNQNEPAEPLPKNSGYVVAGVKNINGYVPFNQTEPVSRNTGYVVAGNKNNPFNQTEPVNRNTGYVVAGIKNCKLD